MGGSGVCPLRFRQRAMPGSRSPVRSPPSSARQNRSAITIFSASVDRSYPGGAAT
jgi:hypothetical protein